jgi:hypothetical protein
MRTFRTQFFKFVLLTILSVGIRAALSIDCLVAGETEGLEASAFEIDSRWMQDLVLPANQLKKLEIDKAFSQGSELYPFTTSDPIFGLALSARIELNRQNSLVRVTLLDQDLREHLIYEAYPLIVDTSQFSIEEACEETCTLDSAKPYSIKLELVDATIDLDKLWYADTANVPEGRAVQLSRDIRTARNNAKISMLRNNIRNQGLKWIAGETTISQMTYEEKKKLFGRNKVPNLQGAEYYQSGIFEIKTVDGAPPSAAAGESSWVESFDWRNRHGADNPSSPYYDDDPSGSGWLTPVKSQGCNHCWAFSPVHATEALVNLYFNQHLDLDLSEQDAASCSGGNMGCCDGGYIHRALDHIIYTGVVNETCFPYSSSCESCGNKCGDPKDWIKIGGRRYPGYSDEDLKRAVIDYGPITCGINSWWHFMVLVGFEKDQDTGETVWIFKNSWGTGWGENGYGHIKVELNDLYGKYILLPPVSSLVADYKIACYDRDGDGYFNWGLAPDKPPSCPAGPPEKDCDDSDPARGPYDSNGHCVIIADYCHCDFAPADGDVDGADLVAYSANSGGISLEEIAAEFGRVNCP